MYLQSSDSELMIVHCPQFIYVHCRLTIGLSVSLGLFAIELAGFFGGISMFMPTQGLICILLLKNVIYFRKILYFVTYSLAGCSS